MTDDEIVVLLTMQFGAPRTTQRSVYEAFETDMAEGAQYNAVTEFLNRMLRSVENPLDGNMYGVVRLRRLYYEQSKINTGSPIDAPSANRY